jgi:succinate-semialdehyde dehydrogenase/glutarate-semialdehyde dehydrogenase
MGTNAVAVDRITNRNPATGQVLSEHRIASVAEVHAEVARARAAQPAWSALGTSRRIAVIRRFQELLLAERDHVAKVITTECGKPIMESLLTEIVVALDSARFCADNAHKVLRTETVEHGNPIMKLKRGRILHEPLGVVGIISPWNYPLSIPASDALAALVTGNAVVIKPSELTPLTALELQRLLHAAGVPKDVLAVVLGEGPTGATLIESGVDKIIFTGSVATGRRVGEAAARRLVPAVLELGGKDPMIVLDDADFEVASSAAVWGSMMNAGQTCISVERCYVHRTVLPQFLAACTEKLLRLKIGSGADPNTDVGPLISERQLQIVEAQVEDARAQGAKILTGGKRLPEIGAQFYAPTLITDLTPAMKLMQEETFGPVLPVIPFGADEEVVRMANDSIFGLAASVFTRNTRRGEAIASRLNAGAVLVNDVLTCFAVPEAPHGGVRASGIGRTHGLIGLYEMVRPKYIASDILPKMKKVWWFPYGETVTRQMSAFVDMLFARRTAKKLSGALGSAASLWRRRL